MATRQKTKSIWGWLLGGIIALALVTGIGHLTARGAAPDYPAPGFTADPNPPAWDTGREGITWCFVPGKGYAWFENNAIRAAGAQPALYRNTGPGVLRSSPTTFPLRPVVPQQPVPCPTCPNGQCPIPRRV